MALLKEQLVRCRWRSGSRSRSRNFKNIFCHEISLERWGGTRNSQSHFAGDLDWDSLLPVVVPIDQ